jgi:hypothetical protein
MMLELKRYRSVSSIVVSVVTCVVLLADPHNKALKEMGLLEKGMPTNQNHLRTLWVSEGHRGFCWNKARFGAYQHTQAAS